MSLYPKDRKLTIVAHSMGGVVVRAALSQGLLDNDSIALYITLGSPHQYSIISVPTLQRFTKVANVPSSVPLYYQPLYLVESTFSLTSK